MNLHDAAGRDYTLATTPDAAAHRYHFDPLFHARVTYVGQALFRRRGAAPDIGTIAEVLYADDLRGLGA
jgi:hypothetical protein